ncbi:MAG: integration host factor subunit alpha [Proteobacteria bacterium]|nr:integration host factor subunit alpha [Pseudomonadota bacterium]
MKHDENKSNAMTRARLSDAIQERYGSLLGLSKQRYIDIVDGFFEEICARLAQGEDVKISSFGSFLVNQKSSRIGRNPKTGKEAEIVKRKVITFRPSHHLKSRVNSKKA